MRKGSILIILIIMHRYRSVYRNTAYQDSLSWLRCTGRCSVIYHSGMITFIENSYGLQVLHLKTEEVLYC